VVKWWRKYVVEVGWLLNVACAASLVVVCLHDFVFAGRPELFQNAGKMWDLVYQLSLALLASFVFFYVNVHIPRQRDRENLQQFLNEKTFRIVQDALFIVRGLEESSGHTTKTSGGDANLSSSDIRAMCSKVHPYSEAPLVLGDLGRNANWMEFLIHFRKRTKETAESIYSKITFLDSDYLKLVIDIDDCSYFAHLRDVASAPLRNNDISFLASHLYDYLQKVWGLQDYAEREFVDTPHGGAYRTLFR
jgi:hypothetical protein